MTVLLESPSAQTIETFDRAMIALGGQPGRRLNDRNFGHLPPFRRSVVSRQAAAEGNAFAAKQVGWQYLVKDSLGLAVVDVSDKITTTFSSVRRGPFANKYEAVLRRIDADRGNAEEIFVPTILEVPQVGSCAVLVRGAQNTFAYPVILSGEFAPIECIDLAEFFEMAISPASSLKSGGDLAPKI